MSQLPTAPDAQPMTTANAQARMASDTKAMTAAPELPPATDSQPMAAINAFRQDAWMRRDPCVPSGGAELSPEWYPDNQALDLAPDGLQTIYRVQFSIMRSSTAPKREQHCGAA